MFMLVLIITGIVLGFMGGWWGMLWIWAALLLLVGMWASMYAFGTAYYDEVRRAVGATPFFGKNKRPPMANPDPDRVNELLSSAQAHPALRGRDCWPLGPVLADGVQAILGTWDPRSPPLR